jgi:CsoR family transcriptional regulator, copper-sensing transcriptional repressor
VRGYAMTRQQYLARLRRIEGQVLGLQRQIEEDTYCIDVLQQIAAVNGALQNVAIALLDVVDRSCGAEGRATVRERCYAEALRGSRAARTRSRPKMNSSAGS